MIVFAGGTRRKLAADARLEFIARLQDAGVSAPIVFHADALGGSDNDSARALFAFGVTTNLAELVVMIERAAIVPRDATVRVGARRAGARGTACHGRRSRA